MYQAIIVDFDGTILDSYQDAFKHLDWLAKRNGLSITPEIRQKMEETWGHTGIEFLQNAFGVERERAKRMYQEWEELDNENPIPLVKGVRETLGWFREQCLTVCILTSRHRESVMSILAREGLQNYFARITAREDSAYSKPDGRAFTGTLQMLTRQNVRREECLFVGDTFVDIEAGRNAGIRTVIVETGPYRNGHDKTHPVPENHVIPSIKDLPDWINSMG
ncbi:MAG: HAD family hydrolase [Patescibacteria group bacterium]|nr:HAD family hydrolase [Patescibacteria group bacterium]